LGKRYTTRWVYDMFGSDARLQGGRVVLVCLCASQPGGDTRRVPGSRAPPQQPSDSDGATPAPPGPGHARGSRGRQGTQAFPMALFAYNPGVKPRAAAEVKALASYGPAEGGRRHRHLLDLARLSLVFGSCEMLQLGLDSVLRQFKVLGVRNLFRCPSRSLVWTRRVEARPATVQEGTKTLFPNPPWLGIRFE
ncbi:unnamed protein product, partial [Prorocentrum cordatum]